MEEPKPQRKAFSPVLRGGRVGGQDTEQAGKPPQAAGALAGVWGRGTQQGSWAQAVC